MGEQRVLDLGPTGVTVAANVERLRIQAGLTYAELSRRLADIGHPIAVLGLSHIEKRRRRVDVDDLAALSVALDVNPDALLLPATRQDATEVLLTGAGWVEASDVWQWAHGERPIVIRREPTPAPAGSMDEQQAEWQRRWNIARQFFQDRVNPDLVVDPGPNVRTRDAAEVTGGAVRWETDGDG